MKSNNAYAVIEQQSPATKNKNRATTPEISLQQQVAIWQLKALGKPTTQARI